MQTLVSVDHDSWANEMQDVLDYLAQYGDRTPQALKNEANAILDSLLRTADYQEVG